MSDDMRDVILSQHQQIAHSQEINKDVKVEGDFDSIILVGMGGSGHPGDLLNALGLTTLPLYVHRAYDLPLDYLSHMGLKSPLIVASSYSGTTEETLSAYIEAQERGLKILASASGSTLQEWSKRDNVPFCLIDFAGYQPRHTLFAASIGIATSLKNSEVADDISDDLNRVSKVLEEKTPTLEEAGKKLAEQMKGKIPIYNSPDSLGFATKNFKIQTNENAKQPAFWNTFPELNHNEMVGFSKLKETNSPSDYLVLLIRDPDAHPRVQDRMDVTASLYKQWGVTVEEFVAEGDTKLEKLFYTITFGMWTTYYLALAYDIDPVPVDGVEDFKAKLKEIAGEIK